MPEIYARRTCGQSPDGGQSRLVSKETSGDSLALATYMGSTTPAAETP